MLKKAEPLHPCPRCDYNLWVTSTHECCPNSVHCISCAFTANPELLHLIPDCPSPTPSALFPYHKIYGSAVRPDFYIIGNAADIPHYIMRVSESITLSYISTIDISAPHVVKDNPLALLWSYHLSYHSIYLDNIDLFYFQK